MRVAPEVSWVPTVSCEVPPVVVVVDVVLVVAAVVVAAVVAVVVVVVVVAVVDVEIVVVDVEMAVVVVEAVVVEVEVTQFMTAVRVLSLVTETALGLVVLPLSSQWSKEQEPYPSTTRLYDWPLLRVNVAGVKPLPTVTPFWDSAV